MNLKEMKTALYEAYKLDYAFRHGMTTEDIAQLYIEPMAAKADESYVRLDEDGRPAGGLDCVDVQAMYEDVINNGENKEPWGSFSAFIATSFRDIGYIDDLIRRMPIDIGQAVFDKYAEYMGFSRIEGKKVINDDRKRLSDIMYLVDAFYQPSEDKEGAFDLFDAGDSYYRGTFETAQEMIKDVGGHLESIKEGLTEIEVDRKLYEDELVEKKLATEALEHPEHFRIDCLDGMMAY